MIILTKLFWLFVQWNSRRCERYGRNNIPNRGGNWTRRQCRFGSVFRKRSDGWHFAKKNQAINKCLNINILFHWCFNIAMSGQRCEDDLLLLFLLIVFVTLVGSCPFWASSSVISCTSQVGGSLLYSSYHFLTGMCGTPYLGNFLLQWIVLWKVSLLFCIPFHYSL